MMNRNFYLLLLFLLTVACQNSEDSIDKSENPEHVELNDSIQLSDQVDSEMSFDVDLSMLDANSYLALFSSSTSDQSVLIEPPCLSECPSIKFERLNNLDDNVVCFTCGQEAIHHKIARVSKENNLIKFSFEDELQLDVELLDSNAINPFNHIEIALSDFHQLYMGYYDDSITSNNSDKLIMMLNNEFNRELLKNQNRWTAIPCPDDIFD